MVLTFDQLPEYVSRLYTKMENIEQLLNASQNSKPEADRWLDLDGLCAYHPDRPKKPTVYAWVSGATIPHHKDGKKLRFLKSEIDEWLLNGKKKTSTETAIDADKFLSARQVKTKGGSRD